MDACATNGHCCSQAYCVILYLRSMISNCQRANCDELRTGSCRDPELRVLVFLATEKNEHPKIVISWPWPRLWSGKSNQNCFRTAVARMSFFLACPKINTAETLFRQSVHCRDGTCNAMAQGCTSHTSCNKPVSHILTHTHPSKISKRHIQLFLTPDCITRVVSQLLWAKRESKWCYHATFNDFTKESALKADSVAPDARNIGFAPATMGNGQVHYAIGVWVKAFYTL